MLELSGVHARFGKAHILRDLGFRAEAGEVLALLGRNGAGKTTTLRTTMQLVRPSAGDVRFEGRSLVGWPSFRVARLGVGYVPEDRRVFTDLTIEENLEVGRQPPRAGAYHWTPDDLYALFPNLAERRGQRGRALSGGEQQMLAIARTLMGNPRLLLLDEPSEGIAPVIVDQLVAMLSRLKREGLAVVLSEQNLHFARAVADRAVVLERGEVRFDGRFAALDEDASLRDEFLAI